MSKVKITDKEHKRFEEIFYRVWHYQTFGYDKHVKMTDKELTRVINSLKQIKQAHQREHDIIVRHYIGKVYYTTIAKEQGVSEGYIRKLAKNGAYYFLQIHDEQ
ncbi:hypothetical protein GU336_08975 [Lactococcus raffinolactis]|uniref:Uncharacterized protein n=1 Tax=Pseudolactococcus raffinolactis TaxID=1366 RepID=A0A6H0UDJ5_9LACT|nr:hypothetical protein [Lactococcus raffinolactis]QIW54260.1 hypothetical protein GU336_08975 [Lactococcus raffinolactis]